MSSSIVMPNLPGFCPKKPMARAKCAGFQMVNGIRMNKVEDAGHEVTSCMSHRDAGSAKWTTTNNHIGSNTSREYTQSEPGMQVLRFFAFFKEGVNESQLERYRVRKVVVYYYMADQTLEISEPKQMNSGIPQGCFLKRAAAESYNLSYQSFQINQSFSVFSRTFKVYDADDATKKWYAQYGPRFGAHTLDDPQRDILDAAIDGYSELRIGIAKAAGGDTARNFGKQNSALKSFMEASLGNSMQRGSDTRSQRKAQFLQNDRRVLSFECEYDDTRNLYGDMMYYTLNYFLADDTVEIKEKRSANSGRDPFPLLLKRQKLPTSWMDEATNDRDRGVEFDASSDMYVTPEDIQVGDQLLVYGKHLKVVDCDAFTRSWYKANPGMHPNGEQNSNCRYVAPEEALPTETPPEYNGYGSEKDSLGSCTHLIPKVPKKDFNKFMANSAKIFRFKAKFQQGHGCRPEHADRKFVIAYFPEDDTQSIFEVCTRNSGIVGGKFLERNAYKSPEGRLYDQNDFNIGEIVIFNSHRFHIYDMDEFTKQAKGA